MILRILTLLLALTSATANSATNADEIDRSASGPSAYPIAISPGKVGTYPALTKSGAGYFYDDVLEYRVWLHPNDGAKRKYGGDVYYIAFAQYEKALEFSKRSKGAEEPLVLIRQWKHVNEPIPGVFEVIDGERITEWKVEWLKGTKRVPGAIEKFMAEHKK